MERLEPFLSLGLALAAGTLIGFEREQSRPTDETKESFLGGARTLPLFALVGAVSVLLSGSVGLWFPAIAFAGVVSLLALSFAADLRTGRHRGLTSEAALLLTFLLGALSATDGAFGSTETKVYVVLAVTVVATVLLSLKPRLHAFLRKASVEDVSATLKFLLVAVVVLPQLPRRTFGPLDVLNPFDIGLMAVLIAGISFTGYVAIRLLGPSRGVLVTAAVGGLASSTAVALSFSGRAKQTPELRHGCALAVVLASTIMFPRVLVEVAVVNAALLPRVALPIAAMGLGGLVASFILWRRTQHRQGAPEVVFHNPFELGTAIKFAALFALVLLGAKAATTFFGSAGSYLAGALAGLTDVDAITLSMANLSRESIPHKVASTTIFIGAVSNTLVKAGIATVVGGWAFGREVALAFGGIVAAGGLGLVVMWLV